MHCKNNESKGDDYPVYESVIRAYGIKNVKLKSDCTINENLQQILNDHYNYNKSN